MVLKCYDQKQFAHKPIDIFPIIQLLSVINTDAAECTNCHQVSGKHGLTECVSYNILI